LYFLERCGTTLGGGARAQTQRSGDRRAMGHDRTASPTTAPLAEGQATAREQSRRRRRDVLGLENGRAVARSARGIPQRVDMLATTATVGRGRHVAADVARLPRPARRAGAARLGERVHRWLVRLGEKGGSDVGKTKRGKGSKWMVVVDGTGIPVRIPVTSPSPAEVTFVDPTLKTIQVSRGGRGRPRPKLKRLIADRGYDSDPLRERLARRGITLIVRTERTAPFVSTRTAATCDAIVTAGSSSAPLRGSGVFVACWFVTNGSRPCTARYSISPQRSSPCGGFETISSH